MKRTVSDERLAALPKASPNAMLSCDPDGSIRYINPAAQRIAERCGYSDVERLLPDNHVELVQTSLQSEKSRTIEVSVDGHFITWFYHPVPRAETLHIYGQEITERKRAERMYGERLKFEQLVSTISTRFINLPTGEVDKEIKNDLRRIVEFLDLDRSSILEFSDDQTRIRVTHSYTAPGFPRMEAIYIDEAFPWYAEKVRRGEIVRISRPEELPGEAVNEREYCLREGFKANLTIPLTVGGSVLGAITFESFRSELSWPDELVKRLQLVGEIFANALARKRADTALRGNQERLARIYAFANDGIFIYDTDRDQIVEANPRGAELLGYTLQEIAGLPISVVHPDDFDRFKNLVSQMARSGSSITDELIYRTKSGASIPVEISASAIRIGARTYMLAITRDITERKRGEEEIRRLNNELEQRVIARTAQLETANEELESEIKERKRAERELKEAQNELIRTERLAILGQLAGGVAHELRNPLGAIKNAAYFLNMALEQPNSEEKEALDVLANEVGASERIISSLLDFARPRAPTRQKVDINDLIQETLARITVPVNVRVTCTLAEELPFALVDSYQLKQVFGNLLRNSLQAMPEGGRLIVKSESVAPEGVAIKITDTGVGISGEDLERIYEPLFTSKAKGIGLGLAVVRTLVERHGGTIEVQSEVGKGSTFTVKLPCGETQENSN